MSSDEDFMPRKRTSSVSNSSKRMISDDSSDDEIPLSQLAYSKEASVKTEIPAPKPKKAVESDSDDDLPLSSIVKGSAAAKSEKKRQAKSSHVNYAESDSEDDLPLSKRQKREKSSKTSGKRRSKATEEDEDDNDDYEDGDDGDYRVKSTKKKTAASRKAKTPTKSKAKSVRKPTKARTTKKKAAASKKTTKRGGKTKRSSSKTSSEGRKMKVLTKMETLEMAMKARRWWNDPALSEGVQWQSLGHNGVLFPDPYVPHRVPLLYDGRPLRLSAAQEELATFFATIPEDGPQLGNEKTRKVFCRNFFKDFKRALVKGKSRDKDGDDGDAAKTDKSKSATHALPEDVKKFELLDFSRIRRHLEAAREEKKNRSKEERQPEKLRKEEENLRFGFALVGGHLEKVGNFRMEPPGLFRGRGDHPKTGTVKKRVPPEEVTLNVGSSDVVPACPVPGRSWGQVIHRDTVTWLAFWQENVMGGTKYVWLAASSSFKGKSDMDKYEKARKLKRFIAKIREDYVRGLKAKDQLIRQRSTAMWVIDVLALRVGNEKGEDEADTVGCCSLRVEHLNFDDETKEISLSFLGKDSMKYENTVNLADKERFGDVGERIYVNLRAFCKNKKKSEEVFHLLSPAELNKHLGSLMAGLSAKVFRTFNASITLQKELPQDLKIGDPYAPKVVAYNDANRTVAILCNHQRTVPKGFEAQMEKLEDKLELLKSQLKELVSMKTKKKKGKPVKVKSANKRNDPEVKRRESHLTAKEPTVEQLTKKIGSWKQKVANAELQIRNKNDNKEVALGTSKINYMDPRITVAWCKRNEVPIERVFPKTLREKFVWAMETPADWTF